MYDVLIKNASVIDGTGSPAFSSDVAICNGKIVMSPANEQTAKEIIDASGLVLSPGFIDAHCHSDETIGNYAGNLCKTSQGVTTEATGHCGETLYPASKDPAKVAMLAEFMKAYLNSQDCGFVDCFSEFT